MRREAGPGSPEPLGVTPVPGGVNVAVFSAHAERILFCLFDPAGAEEIVRIPLVARTGDVHHAFVPGVALGERYGLRAEGPWAPLQGHRFNPAKLLVDPYATLLDRPFRLAPAMFGFRRDAPGERDETDSVDDVPRAIVVAPHAPAPGRLRVPWDQTVVQEVHVRGLSMRHPAIPDAIRGTFGALAHPALVEHWTRQGITTLELMPAMAWLDERHLPPLGLANAWGYNPVALLAPDPRLAPGGWDEIAHAIATLQKAGLEVILDVVLNHTAESDALGPTVSMRGLDNASYYRLAAGNPGRFVDDTGCGNTLALDHPAVLRLSLDALRHWAGRAGLDGFRFDLAATLGRRATGFDKDAPFLQAIAQDPVLRELKMVAEPWDIGPGGYQPGGFPAAWGEWNDAFRDDVRRFWRGEPDRRGALATRLAGSSDRFGAKRRPSRSVNFVTAHDGFTLADLVAYERKRNHANGEDNRDGTDANFSWNNGVEGPSADPAILDARRRDQRALLATLFVARGTPMLSMGSEFGFSQQGNNNAYAQDNAISWPDWEAADHDLARFAQRLAALRREVRLLHEDRFLDGGLVPGSDLPDVAWLDTRARPLDGAAWADPAARTLVMVLAGPAAHGAERVAIALNAGHEDVPLRLPDPQDGTRWMRLLDSALPDEPASPFPAAVGVLAARSVAVFVEEPDPARPQQRPASDPLLERLGDALGIAPVWYEETGTRHVVTPDTRRALVEAMGLPAGTRGEILDALARLAAERERRALPAGIAAWEGRPVEVPMAPRHGAGRIRLLLAREDGARDAFLLDPAALPTRTAEAVDGRLARRLQAVLPALPVGRHVLVREDAPDCPCVVTVAPPRCEPPPGIGAERRIWGIAAHLYTLRRDGDCGIGDFTALAALAEAAGREGTQVLGLNPLHAMPPAERDRASPYNPLDRRFLDPIYLDVAALGEADPDGAALRVLAAAGAGLQALQAAPSVDYPGSWSLKEEALRAAFAGFERLSLRNPDDRAVAAFAAFGREGGPALERFADFQALAAQRPGLRWTEWEPAIQEPGSAEAAAELARLGEERRFSLWTQWLCDRQLAAAAARGREAGLSLGLYRDLAVGAAMDSAEVWAGGEAYARGPSVGSPPDLFSRDGQVWSLPPPNPLAMARDGGRGFAALVAANMRHAGALRIDHAMALSRLFWVPEGASPAQGAYVRYPREMLLGQLALESRRARCVVVGEDLGTVEEGFRERMADAGILSYRVLWFERRGREFIPPQNYPALAAACVSTHDLPTLAGWWQGADIAERQALGLFSPAEAGEAREARAAEKRTLLAALSWAGFATPEADPDAPMSPAVAAAIHAFVAATPSALMLVQADDLAGETEAVNLPGTDRERPNWRRRLSRDLDGLFGGPLARAVLDAVRRERGGEG